jgi:pilus assembly protein CpaF
MKILSNKSVLEKISNIKSQLSDNSDHTISLSDDELMLSIDNHLLKENFDVVITCNERIEIAEYIFNSIRKYDILQTFIDDSAVSEIMVNGHKNIFIEKNSKIYEAEIAFQDEEVLYNIIQNIVSKINRSVNESDPITDARLKDGSRINIVLPPIALDGPVLTIRKFPKFPMQIADMINIGTISEEASEFLRKSVIEKKNIFISGGTATGKTTFLNVLSSFIPTNERIITIEDSAELKIQNVKNIVRLEARNANSEGRGEVKIRDLIKTSLRMRPDRIIVGEVRGEEVIDMLQAMNTGHSGSISTGHSNSVTDMLSRLETMVLLSSAIPLDAVRRQIASAIDLVVHLYRTKTLERKVFSISAIEGIDSSNNIVITPIFEVDESTDVLERRIEFW